MIYVICYFKIAGDHYMGRIGISYSEVAQAAAELQGYKKNPTVDAIRELLGTGSKSTIARHLREWRANQGLQNPEEASLPGELLALVRGLWERLQTKSDEDMIQLQKECSEKIQASQQQCQTVEQYNQAQKREILILEEKLQEQTQNTLSLQKTLIDEQTLTTRLTERTSALDQQRQQQDLELQKLHGLLRHVQENLEHYQTSTQQLREEQALIIDKQRQAYEHRIYEGQQQASTQTQRITELQIQLNQSQYEVAYLAKAQADQNLSMNSLRQQLNEVQVKYDVVVQQYEAVNALNKGLDHQLLEKIQELCTIEERLVSAQENVNQLKQILKITEEKIRVLEEQKIVLAQEKANLAGQFIQLQTAITL